MQYFSVACCFLSRRSRYSLQYSVLKAEIAQSAQRLATGWTIKGSKSDSRWRQEFSILHVVQTGSGAHPAFYPIGTGGSFFEDKATGE
jgi:hypothetical protein